MKRQAVYSKVALTDTYTLGHHWCH